MEQTAAKASKFIQPKLIRPKLRIGYSLIQIICTLGYQNWVIKKAIIIKIYVTKYIQDLIIAIAFR